jgi:hypothetical protein
MTRASSGDTVVIKPYNNIYTSLVIVATIAVALALVVVYMRGKTIGYW